MKIYDENKVEALRVYILKECKRQGFTVREFQWLVMKLQTDSANRQQEVEKELF